MSTVVLHSPQQSHRSESKVRVFTRERAHTLLLILIVLLCAGVRMYHLGAAALWSDEIFSRYYLDVFGLHFTLTDGLSLETNPPTYYFLLRGWMALFGHGEAALRSLSVLASTLCIPFLYMLGRELAGKWCGLLGAFLFAACPTSLYFAQETRSYAFLMLAGTILLWAAAVLQRDSRSTIAAIVYLLSGTFCLYLHATGLLFVAACGAAVWLHLLTSGRRKGNALAKWTLLNFAVVLLGVPYYIHAFTASKTGIINYVPAAGLHQFIYSISLAVSGIVTPYPWPGFLMAIAVLLPLGLSLCLSPLSRRATVTLIGVPVFFIGFVFLVSVHRPILLPRTLVWILAPLCIVAARQMRVGRLARWGVVAGMAIAFGGGMFFQLTRPNSNKEPFRDVVKTLSPELGQPGLVVLSPSSDPMVLAYYAPQMKDVRMWDEDSNHTIFGAAARSAHVPSVSEAQILQAIHANEPVVVVSHSFDLNRLNDLRRQAPATTYQEWYCGKVVCVAAATWEPTTQASLR
jgi:hypothetical protein